MPPCKGDSGKRVRPCCATSTGTTPLPRPRTGDTLGPAWLWLRVPMSHPSPATHLQGVVEELPHAVETARLPLLLLQPAQRVRDVPLLDGHVGSGLPEGLEDECRQPVSQRDVGGMGKPGLEHAWWQEEPGGGWSPEGCCSTACLTPTRSLTRYCRWDPSSRRHCKSHHHVCRAALAGSLWGGDGDESLHGGLYIPRGS